jgi:hypothetical protein
LVRAEISKQDLRDVLQMVQQDQVIHEEGKEYRNHGEWVIAVAPQKE